MAVLLSPSSQRRRKWSSCRSALTKLDAKGKAGYNDVRWISGRAMRPHPSFAVVARLVPR